LARKSLGLFIEQLAKIRDVIEVRAIELNSGTDLALIGKATFNITNLQKIIVVAALNMHCRIKLSQVLKQANSQTYSCTNPSPLPGSLASAARSSSETKSSNGTGSSITNNWMPFQSRTASHQTNTGTTTSADGSATHHTGA
jgi:hypothetical protein